MTRFLCVGDLHLGAGPDFGREPGDRLADQEAVWARALELAVEHQVDAVLFAGDAFHRRRPTPAELRAFQRPVENLFAEHGIEVLAINGNHDVEAAALPSALELFGREVDLHTAPGIWRAPDGVRDQLRDIASVATLPWTPTSTLIAARDGGDRDRLNAAVAEVLIARARDLRAQIDGPAVLLLHWSVSGASTPTGIATDEFREVVLPLTELEQLGYDAIVCGHIHRAQILTSHVVGHIEPSPGVALRGSIFYTGSPAPVDFGEADAHHGVWLLDTNSRRGTNEHGVDLTFLPIESRPFVTLDFDYTDPTYGSDLVDSTLLDDIVDTARVTDAVVRVRYTATEEQARRVDHHAIRDALVAAGAHKVYAIQPTITRASRARVERVDDDITPLAAVVEWCGASGIANPLPLVDLTSTYLETTEAGR